MYLAPARRIPLIVFIFLIKNGFFIAKSQSTECGPYSVYDANFNRCVDYEWCMYKFYNQSKSWFDAKAICEQDNMTLAQITTYSQYSYLYNLMINSLPILFPSPPSSVWLGAYQPSGGKAIWQDVFKDVNTSFIDTNQTTDEACFLLANSNTFQADSCTTSLPFVCQEPSYVGDDLCIYNSGEEFGRCFTSAATLMDVSMANVFYDGLELFDCVNAFAYHERFVGIRYELSYQCHCFISYSGMSYMKGTLYIRDMLRTEIPGAVSASISNLEDVYTSHVSELCSSSPQQLPVIETTLPPDSVSIMHQTTLPITSTSQMLSGVSSTGTVAVTPTSVLGAALQNLSGNIGQMNTANMSQLIEFSEQLLDLVLNHPDLMCSNLRQICQVENNITKRMATLSTAELDIKSTLDSHLRIMNGVYDFATNITGCRHSLPLVELLDLQDTLVRRTKLYLRLQNTHVQFEDKGISVSITVTDWGALQDEYTTTYGRVIVQNVYPSRRMLSSRKVLVMVISYKENPFRQSNLQDHTDIHVPVITTAVFEEDGEEMPDTHFLMGLPTSANLNSKDNQIDMLSNGTQYMAAFPGGFFNSSPAMLFVDVSKMGPCRIYGKYGTQKPTDQNFDFYLHTDGLLSVTKYRPYNFTYSFIGGVIQLPVYRTPVIIIAHCQAGKISKHLDVPTICINQVSPQVIDKKTNKWKSASNVKLVGRGNAEITLKSYFFGTFTASVKMIPPDMIDFQSVFLNFSEKLMDTPYVLCTVLVVLIALVITTLILRRRDNIDSALWTYHNLIDNKASSTFPYYICVSTGIRSNSHITSSVYINIIGTRDETGTRLLAVNDRKNFGRGTSSHFYLKSDVYLGNIKTVQIWLGNDGLQSLYLSRVVIIDGTTGKAVQLKCNNWLSLKKGSGQTWRTLRFRRNNDSRSHVSEVSVRHIFDDHLWFSLLFRPYYSRFTRVQRLWSIASLLFLSMFASAMYYNTSDDTLPLLKTEYFVLGYKEIYTGLMSSVITVIPSVIMTYIFSNRRIQGEKPFVILHDDDKLPLTGNLPWWSIFLGYIVLALCMICGSYFTFLYSLEWGPSLTIQWMSAFFLGTTESVTLIEPTKAIVLAVLLVCLCSGRTNRRDFCLPSLSQVDKKRQLSLGQERTTRREVKCPCDQPETTDQMYRRYTLRMDRKLNRLLKNFVFGMIYVGIILLIGTQQRVSDVNGQNMHIKNMLKSTQQVRKMEDVWDYIHNVVIQRLYPSEFYSFEELRLVGDFYKMGPIRLRQIRVSGACSAPSLMRNYGIICIPEYNTDIEDTMNYGQGWIAENISDPWYNSIRPYQYHHHKPDATPPYYGHFGTYGDGGFLADLDSVPTIAIDVARKLQSDVWLDRRTRVLFIEGCFVNRNNMLFTQIQIVFEFPSTGGIFMETAVATSNLYPYTTTFDFIVLFMQIIFLITILVRFVLVVANVLKTGGKSLVTVSQVFALFHLGASIAAVVFLVMRFTSTIAVLNTIRQDIGFYTSFGYVFHCDEYYSFFLGLITFIAIIDLLKHLSFNYHLFLINKAILAFRMELFQFTVALAVLIVGFACLIYLIYGHTERNFRSIPFGVLTLFRMTIGMIKFRKDIQVAVLSLFIIIGIYTSISTIFFMNVFISSLDNRFSHIKKLIKNGMTTYDWHLSRHFWNRLTRLITICGANKRKKTAEIAKQVRITLTRSSALRAGNVQISKMFFKFTFTTNNPVQALICLLDIDPIKGSAVHEGESTICKLLSKVMKIIGDNDEKFERDVLQLLLRKLKRRCRRIETYNGVQYRFTMDRSAADEALILEFFDTLMRTGIDVDIYTISEASRKGLIPYGDFTEPISMVYKIGLSKRKHARTYRRDVMAGGESLCKVVIKVPSSRLSCRHTFLITLCDNYGDWRQHTAIQDITQEEVYLSATISSCPRYIMAVASDILPGISTTILQNNSFEYLLTKRGGVFYPPGLCKRIVFIFPAESVLLDTTITILLERGEKFPILHVVASGDVSGPTTVMYIRKEEQEHLPTENMPEIKLLTKEGDLEWKEGVTGRQTAGKDLCVEIDSLQKGVKISVSACESNYVRNLARTANKCLDHNKKILFGIHRKFIATKHWRQIGHALGFSQESLAKIENKKNRSLQEKTCVVLERWLRLNPGKNLYEILTDWV